MLQAKVWGISLEIDDSDTKTLANLREREKRFQQISLSFYPQDMSQTFKVNLFVADEKNPLFLGDAPIDEMVTQILQSRGPSGPNSDYLFNLAQSMKCIGDEAYDDHLKDLETAVKLKEKEIKQVVN